MGVRCSGTAVATEGGARISVPGERVNSMGQRLRVVVCDWCKRVVSTAPGGAEVTHTICASCLDFTFSPCETGMEPSPDSGPFRLPDRYVGLDDLEDTTTP